MTAEDREFIERVLAGERAAFDGLVRKYNRTAGAIAYAIVGDFSAAEDVVQDAFIKAYRCLASLRDPDRFRVWLAGIVRTQAIDWLRRRKAFWSVPLSQAFADDPGGDDDAGGRSGFTAPPVEELYAREELREKVLEAIRGLPEEDRVVVTLKHMDGLSYKEIADITGSTVGAVESRLFRARQVLRKRIEHILK